MFTIRQSAVLLANWGEWFIMWDYNLQTIMTETTSLVGHAKSVTKFLTSKFFKHPKKIFNCKVNLICVSCFDYNDKMYNSCKSIYQEIALMHSQIRFLICNFIWAEHASTSHSYTDLTL